MNEQKKKHHRHIIKAASIQKRGSNRKPSRHQFDNANTVSDLNHLGGKSLSNTHTHYLSLSIMAVCMYTQILYVHTHCYIVTYDATQCMYIKKNLLYYIEAVEFGEVGMLCQPQPPVSNSALVLWPCHVVLTVRALRHGRRENQGGSPALSIRALGQERRENQGGEGGRLCIRKSFR